MSRPAALALLAISLVSLPARGENPNWPPVISHPAQDLANPMWWPDDGSFGGDWNYWGFFPVMGVTPSAVTYTGVDPLTGNVGVGSAEQAAGIGMGFDRAWQVSIGDPHVVIGIIDSGFLWNERDLVNKWFLNRGELPPPNRTDCVGADPYDCNGDGLFNIQDYTNATGHQQPNVSTIVDRTLLARADHGDVNGNGFLDPQDLIAVFSDHLDNDSNGFVDDICGWDFLWDDNDADDDILNGGQGYSHGHGEAMDSSAEGNNGMGDIGTCPRCLVLPIRGSDSFVGDGPGTASGIEYALMRGARVAQIAQVALSNSPLLQRALDDAYYGGMVVVASGADEGSAHQMMPGNREHTLMVNGVLYNGKSWNDPNDYTFINFADNTNWGGHMDLTASCTSAASEATGRISGELGLIFSYARQLGVTPDLSAGEAFQLATMSAYDINIPNSGELDEFPPPDGGNNPFSTDLPNLPDGGVGMADRYPSQIGWDSHFSYGRANPRAALDMLGEGRIPPEVDITPGQADAGENSPQWYQVYDPTRTTLTAAGQDLTGTVGINIVVDTHGRLDSQGQPLGFDYIVEEAIGLEPPDTAYSTLFTGTAVGSFSGQAATLNLPDLVTEPGLTFIDGGPFEITNAGEYFNPQQYAVTVRVRATAHYGGTIGDVVGSFRKTIYVHEDDDVMPGFPIRLGASGEASPKLVDLDHNGTDEIILATSDGLLHVLEVNGTEWPGFPVQVGQLVTNGGGHCGIWGVPCPDGGSGSGPFPAPSQTIFATPAVGDLNHDGNLEIVVSTMQGFVHVFDLQGNELPNFPVQMEVAQTLPYEAPNAIGINRRSGQWTIQPAATLSDGGSQGRIDKLDEVEQGFMASPVLYDLNGDGKLEIIQAGMDGFLHVWNSSGSELPGFPAEIRDRNGGVESGYTLTSRCRLIDTPAVGDLFGDGGAEIVLGSNEVYEGISGARLYVVNRDGTYAPGFPTHVEGVDVFALPYVGKGIMDDPVLADLRGDGHLEIVVNPVGSGGFVYDAAGNKLFTTSLTIPQRVCAPPPDGGATVCVPELVGNSKAAPTLLEVANATVADIDGDGKLDMVSATVDALSQLLNASGVREETDHQLTAWAIGTAAVVAANHPTAPPDATILPAFPQLVPDYQFLTNFTVADLDGDGLPEVIGGSGMFLLTAFNFQGVQPSGWPKFTGAWNMATPAVGDLNGDGLLDVVLMDRNGELWAWSTSGKGNGNVQWDSYHHDQRNTGNVGTALEARNGTPGSNTNNGGCGCQGPDAGLGLLGLIALFARRRRS